MRLVPVLVVGLVEIVIEELFRGVVPVVSTRERCSEYPKYLHPNTDLPRLPLLLSL